MRYFLGILQWLWLVIMVTPYYLIFTLPITIIMAKASYRTRHGVINFIWEIFSKLVLRVGFMARLVITDHRSSLIKTNRFPGGLFAANHLSLFDIPLIMSKIQIPPIMKKEILRIPIFGYSAYWAGAIPVDRKDPNARKNALYEAQNRLLRGEGVQIYPEGTRSKTFTPKPFSEIKTPLFHFCYKNKLCVTPVVLKGSHLLLKKGLPQWGQKVEIILYEPLWPKDFSSVEEFSEKIWQTIVDGFNSKN